MHVSPRIPVLSYPPPSLRTSPELSVTASRPGHPADPADAEQLRREAQAVAEQASHLLELFRETGSATRLDAALRSLAAQARDWISCDRVAIALGDEKRCRLKALSGVVARGRQGELLRALESAMHEALLLRQPVACPHDGDVANPDHPGATSLPPGTAHLLVVPLIPGDPDREAPVGAWAFLWEAAPPALPRSRELAEAASPFVASLIDLLERAHAVFPWQRRRAADPRRARIRRIATIAGLFLLAGLMAVPIPYRIGAQARLEPLQARQIAAPFDGILREPHVRAGEQVEANQLLATLDGKEISWKLAGAVAEKEQALKRRNEARSRNDFAAAQMAQHELDGLTAEVELLSWQQANLEIRAPSDGLVLAGNLERSAGVPVTTGQKLFEIAPIDQLRVELKIPDREISRVEPGMEVRLRLEAQAAYERRLAVDRIHPIAETEEGENIFVAETTLPNAELDLRPGMAGKARIISDARPLGWILLHRPWEWVRVHLWW